jgi:hypothetical protein
MKRVLWPCASIPSQMVDLLLTGFSLRSGEFADVLGEDYLGLRALGIAAEFGLSNLSIPKKLLKGKKGQNKPTALVFFFLRLYMRLIFATDLS